ncbi:alpha-ketoacid dehydrogenase subunit beta [Hazenella sp. IB182357]|uniref:Alpha-ketoacid dehydrogenase subunit beta n=1 Tax=Polycladospora coralii TaxID=2771432 RepID=A0A926N7F2_9BACL|nr:alpha-ketoacid dehydrogenase subunit beta [Polycladospora coralii]MBD1370823.1 alpha-ketoacid dehydrogenase subunit beta [Polycladospora coralii]
MPQMTMVKAINDALRVELKRDENVLIFGEDVGKNGGVFRVTEHLQEEFGNDRVMDTPLAESGIGGLAVGLAVQGFRPVAEMQFIGFIFEALDSIAVQAPRMRYRSGGRYQAPITFRAPFGGGVKPPELHGDSLEGILCQTPGIKVVVPSNPYDAKGLMISAIRENDPVFVLEHLKLYFSQKGEVPEGEYTVPIGKANTVKEGSDVTILTYGAMVHTSLKAAEIAEKERGTMVEVIDLRTISPLDTEAIVASVNKTGRAIVVQEAQKSAGIAAEVMAQINEHCILQLEAPVERVTGPDTVLGFPLIEEEWLPSPAKIVKAINRTLDF